MYLGISAATNRKTHLDALNGDLLGVDHNSVKVAGKDGRDSCLVLVRRRLAEVVNSAMNAREEAAEAEDRILQPRLALGFTLVGASFDELAQRLLQAVLDFGLAYSGCQTHSTANSRYAVALLLSLVELGHNVLLLLLHLFDLLSHLNVSRATITSLTVSSRSASVSTSALSRVRFRSAC